MAQTTLQAQTQQGMDVQNIPSLSCNQKSTEMQKMDKVQNPMMCYTTGCVFGILVILGLLTQIILQAKTLKQLRKKR